MTTIASWADAWLDALAEFSHPGRMRRGQRFAARGQIRRFDVQPGQVSAVVREGAQTYQSTIKIDVLDEATWVKIVSRLASQALYSARLLAGEMPPEVVEVFEAVGAPLFPEATSLRASCTCPDWEVPCKHIAALYYLLAERFDEDPFLLFLLRGRGKEQLLGMLRQHRQAGGEDAAAGEDAFFGIVQDEPAPPLADQLDHFWSMDAASIEQVSFTIARPETALPLLKRLGAPSFTSLDVQALLAPVYEEVTNRALEVSSQ